MVGLAVSNSNAFENGSSVVSSNAVLSSVPSVTPWTYPTTTMQEPGYTNGTYTMAATSNVEHLNVYLATDVYSFYLLDEIYDEATNLLPNETISPWLATNWTETQVTSTNVGSFLGMVNSTSNKTIDPLTGIVEPVQYVYTVHIRPGVQWTDWTSANAGATYIYSNTTIFNGPSGTSHTATYNFPSMSMKTYYVQSADFILSWKILQSSSDYSGSFSNVVNVVPVNNLTVDFYLSNQSATFVTYTLETPILPYHIWVNHDYSTVAGVWNYTASPPSATGGYNNWDVSYNPSTGQAPELVGTGPFMMNGGYGMPKGQWIFDQYWKLYVNPHYFVQYTNSLRQWTPKFYELYVPEYLSLSSAVIALSLNQVYQIEGGVTPTFISTISTMSHTYIYEKPTTGYGYIQLNSFGPGSEANASANAYEDQTGPFTPASIYPPLNITAVRQALNYAVNKVYLNSVVEEGYGIPGTSVVPDSDSVWQNHSLPTFAYSPAKAMQLLNSTPGMKYIKGEYYYDGTQFTMDIQITSAASNPLGVEGALLIQQWWDAIGVKTTVTQEAFSTIVSNLLDYGYSAIELGISGIEGDPTGDFTTFYTPQGYGTGFYLGPFTSLNSTTYPGLSTSENGTYVDNEMVELYNIMNTNTTLSTRIAAGNEIQGIAAYESTMINTGYGIDLFPIDNSTFVNITKDQLSQTGFEYWNFMSVHLRSQVTAVLPPSKIPEKLSVGVVTPVQVYTNGQYGNVTVQVRNQYGASVSGANITMGASPSGALLNITSMSGVTNSNGIYTLEFKVLDNQPLVYTSDYMGEINISATASMTTAAPGSVVPGIGYTYIDVQPEPIAYKVLKMPALNDTSNKWQPMQIEVYNPLTGDPVPNYSITLQTNAGIINMTNVTYDKGSSLTMLAGNSYNELYYSVNNSGPNYSLWQVTGTTASNGTFTVMLKIAPGVDFNLMGSNLESYIFLGDYSAGAPVSGEAPYTTIGQITSATNPNGFGTLQPVELPIQVTQNSPMYKIILSTSANNISTPSGSIIVNVTVLNSTGNPVPNFTVDLISQNALGANRGYFSGNGSVIQVTDQNSLFGSLYMPGIQLITGSTGQASAIFNASLYTVDTQNGYFIDYSPQSFTDPYLIPADDFEISAVGVTGTAVSQFSINSSQMVNNVPPSPMGSAYFQSVSSVNGITLLTSGSSYTVYVNSTYNSPAGPTASGVPFTISATFGTFSETSNTTNSNGTYRVTYTAPKVSALTPVTITVTVDGVSHVITAYVQPTTPPPSNVLYYSLIGIFAALTVIFAALFAMSRRRVKLPPKI